MLLVHNVVYQGKVAAQMARDLHRSKALACEWLKRYDKEDINGLKTRQKNGRPTEISEEIGYEIKQQELKESNQKGEQQNRGGRVNHKEKRHKISFSSHIPHPS